VPSDQIRAAHDRFARAICFVAFNLGLAISVTGAHAAGLGRLNVQSALGQPLRAEVDVPTVSQDEAPTLQIHLAPQSAFRQANLEFNPALTQLRFDLEPRGDGSYVVRVTSAQPINEPFLDLLLELSWSTGRVLREYTVLLDPPGLKTAPEVVPPVAAQPEAAPPPAAASAPEAAPAPAPAAQAPIAPAAPAPAAPQAQAPAPAPVAPAPIAAAPKPAPQPRAKPAPVEAPTNTSYRVKEGDTLGRIALENKSGSVSLDQMLVALLRANPNAFIKSNMNLVLAGTTLTLPSDSDARAVDPNQAHREVIAQSEDFNAYRSRIAQAVEQAPAPPPAASKAAVQGKVVAKVEEKGAPPKSGDQLKIAKAEAASSAATQSADETKMRQRLMKEEQTRAEALKKTNEKLAKELEIVSKAATLAQQQAKAKADAEQLRAEQAAAKARAEADAAKAKAEAAIAKAKAEADASSVRGRAEAEAAAARAKEEAAAAQIAKDRAEAEAAVRARLAAAEAAKRGQPPAQATPVAPAPPANVAKSEAPKPAAPQPAPAGGESLMDQLTSTPVLGGLGVVLLSALLGINFYRKRKVEHSDQFKATGDGMRANSLFGATGGQSVDTGATSTFNSSFIPAASQLDSNEVDPVAEADVYIAYGREEQAEEILKEALRLQSDRVGVRVKLLEIYARRGDKAAFATLAQELHDRSGGAGEEWERAAKLGRSLDPTNPLFSGGAPGASEPAHGPITELRLAAAADSAAARPLGPSTDLDGMASSTQPLTVEMPSRSTGQSSSTVLGMPPTRQAMDSRLGDTKLPVDSQIAPSTRGSVLPAASEPGRPTVTASTLPLEEPAKISGIDFGALDFDLGPTKGGAESATVLMPVPEEHEASPARPGNAREAPTVPSIDLMFEQTAPASRRSSPPTATGSVPMPEIDLNLPSTAPGGRPTQPAPSSLEEALSRPTLLGAVGALPDEQASRLNSNTDQATVPLIDFDLSGTESTLTGRRTETQAGTPLASQMATKLDLARGYIDLGVKDGARELLEEVMRDGTREQRQQAVELIKMVEA